MAVTEIPWDDGSGGKIYLTYPSASGDQAVSVSSDANTGAARSKVVTFTSGVGSITRTLTVSQDAGTISPIFYTFLYFDGTAYIETDYILPQLFSLTVSLGHETKKGSQVIFYADGGNGGFRITYTSNTTSTNRRMGIYYDSTSINSSNRNLAWSYNEFSFFVTPQRFGWGNTTYTYTKGSNHPTGGVSFGYSSVQPYTGRMSNINIYDSSAQSATSRSNLVNNFTPVATFKPCTYNGEAGFWHVEGNKFYGNTAGTGTLTVSNS